MSHHIRASSSHLKLHANCKLVRGTAFSAIYDFERRLLVRFSDKFGALAEIIASPQGLDFADFDQLNERARENVETLVKLLLDNEIAYVGNDRRLPLSQISEAWDAPQQILNSIIDVDRKEPDWEALLQGLSALGCSAVQIRCFSVLLEPPRVEAVLDMLARSGISHVEIYTAWTTAWDGIDPQELFASFPNLVMLEVHSAQRDDKINPAAKASLANKVFRLSTRRLTGTHHCGDIDLKSLLRPRANLFAELRQFNGCLNRKVSLRADGSVCNCPSMRASFGSDIAKLADIVGSPEFQAPWRLNKDRFETCGGCEFRYVCTDCRAYLESDLSLRKPARCRYDPTTGIWVGSEALSAVETL
jgi:SPASM domain peptide maturase of grasp-with-spasm system